jgi:hypothetical protein
MALRHERRDFLSLMRQRPETHYLALYGMQGIRVPSTPVALTPTRAPTSTHTLCGHMCGRTTDGSAVGVDHTLEVGLLALATAIKAANLALGTADRATGLGVRAAAAARAGLALWAAGGATGPGVWAAVPRHAGRADEAHAAGVATDDAVTEARPLVAGRARGAVAAVAAGAAGTAALPADAFFVAGAVGIVAAVVRLNAVAAAILPAGYAGTGPVLARLDAGACVAAVGASVVGPELFAATVAVAVPGPLGTHAAPLPADLPAPALEPALRRVGGMGALAGGIADILRTGIVVTGACGAGGLVLEDAAPGGGTHRPLARVGWLGAGITRITGALADTQALASTALPRAGAGGSSMAAAVTGRGDLIRGHLATLR